MARPKRQVIVVATTAALVIGGGGYAIAEAGSTSATYRLATATVGSVERTLTLGGTVNSSARDNVSFAQSGKVKAVYVAQGEHVKAGQVLAALDPTSTDATLLSAKASLAKAQAASASTTASQAQSVAGASTSKTSGSNGATSSVSTALLKKAQDALRAAVQQSDKAMQTAQAAGSDVSVGCGGVPGVSVSTGAPKGHGSPTAATPAPTATPTGSPTSGPATGPTQAQLQQCSDVLAALSRAQVAVSSAQQAEQIALNGLARVLSQASSQPASSASSTSASPSSSNSSRSTGGAGAQGSGSGSSSTNSASRLASNQAQVDQAEAQVVAAQVVRDNTVLRAPISGRVVAVGATVGSAASTSSTAVTLVGSGPSAVVVSVPLAQIPHIKVGQRARVVVSGSNTVISAVVTTVGILASTSSSGTTTYPVTISLTGTSPALQGIGASVTIVTGSVTGVLTVPSSAITTTALRSTVGVYGGGKVTATVVTVGVMGSTSASITSGLKAGQEVALADLGASVPTSNTSGTGLRGFGGGGPNGGLGGGTFRARTAG